MTEFPGARWWKLDFHTHTPASGDYGKGSNQAALRNTTPEDWLLNFMRAGIDCVAVTDHNSGEWIDKLKQAFEKLKAANHSEFRQLYLFPGVEITANGGIHVLAVLDASKTGADIDSLLGAIKYRGTRGESQSAAECSVIQVIEEISKAGAIPILAHADASGGAFTLGGSTLGPILESKALVALEIRDASLPKPAVYSQKNLQWAEVLGSDSHHPSGGAGQCMPGSHFTWVKMDIPSLDGLKLALHDAAPLSIRRSDKFPAEQNILPDLWVEELEIQSTRWMGRGKIPLKAKLNPWLNAVVGGRGTGKSSLINFMRIVLRRDNELPRDLEDDFKKFKMVRKNRNDPNGVMLNETTASGEATVTTLRLIYRKGNARLRINWRPDAATPVSPIEERQADGSWREVPGDIRQRFPVRMFNQKQIFSMAVDPQALLRIIDEAPEVGKAPWQQQWDETVGQFFALRAKHRELHIRIQERPKMEGELADTTRKLSVFEGAAHANVLKNYQLRQRQERSVLETGEELRRIEQQLREVSARLFVSDFDRSQFDPASPADKAILQLLDEAARKGKDLSASTEKLAADAKSFRDTWLGQVEKTDWQGLSRQARTDYEALNEKLKIQGVTDPAQYGSLVQQRQILEQKIKAIDDLRTQIEGLDRQSTEALGRLSEQRHALTKSRQKFLEQSLSNNPLVRIEILPFGRDTDLREIERDFRKVIEREEGFAAEILSEDRTTGIIADIYRDLPANDTDKATSIIKQRLSDLRNELLSVAAGAEQKRFNSRFAKHLQQLKPESLDRIRGWYPEDGLAVSYKEAGKTGFSPIGQGSPGQKTAAILAFLLSHGTEPMLLDQPEDDLDNHLIYDLIVHQLRENKQRRQLLVVTHNPNIVVNGDAELIFPMEQKNGRCIFVEPPGPGSMQSRGVRDEVCRVMEGGRSAFEKRYRRIFLE